MLIDVTCAIIIRDKRILVTRRSERMSMPLKWEFPGGKVEPGESPEDCLLRELMEELNIRVNLLHKLDPQPYHYPDFSIRLLPFVATFGSGEIVLHEHMAYQWLTTDELPQIDWAAADIPVLNAFLEYKARTEAPQAEGKSA